MGRRLKKGAIRDRRGVVLRIDPLLKLAASGDLTAVKRELRGRPALLNAMSAGHHRALLWEAANANRMDLVEYLVERGAGLDVPGRYRSETFVLLTPHCIARARGRREVAEFLLARGASMSTRRGRPPAGPRWRTFREETRESARRECGP